MGGRFFVGCVFGLAFLALAGCATKPPKGYESPVAGDLTSHYGARARGFHHGVDIAAPKGTRVRAARGGKVVYRGRQRGFGRLVIIDHGDGIQSYYAHLSRFATRKGHRVKRGEVIGRVGKSGRASGHHLHFELRRNGHSVNPEGYVPF
jgi:murein DD-endopeptidase MepM/ murein hydrolase activator NlpD